MQKRRVRTPGGVTTHSGTEHRIGRKDTAITSSVAVFVRVLSPIKNTTTARKPRTNLTKTKQTPKMLVITWELRSPSIIMKMGVGWRGRLGLGGYMSGEGLDDFIFD